jgi:hypothetical protein
MSESGRFVLFTTDLFVFEQQEKDIDQWFVGGDCAGWFYARLLSVDGVRKDMEPLMEDWGWTFALSVNGLKVWVNIWAFHAIDNCWLLGVEARKGMFRRERTEVLDNARDIICDGIEQILKSDSRFLNRRWYAENPFDLDIRAL